MKGTEPPFTRSYRPMSIQELKTVKKYLDEQLAKGFIRSSSFPVASSLTIRKPGPCLCG
jgi:hypothetical protein